MAVESLKVKTGTTKVALTSSENDGTGDMTIGISDTDTSGTVTSVTAADTTVVVTTNTTTPKIKRAAITGGVGIPAASNVATVLIVPPGALVAGRDITITTVTGKASVSTHPTPAATAIFGTHTLVSGTAYQPNATTVVQANVYVTHAGKVTLQILSSATVVKATLLTAAAVIVGQGLPVVLPAGDKIKVTLATTATVGTLHFNTF